MNLMSLEAVWCGSDDLSYCPCSIEKIKILKILSIIYSIEYIEYNIENIE